MTESFVSWYIKLTHMWKVTSLTMLRPGHILYRVRMLTIRAEIPARYGCLVVSKIEILRGRQLKYICN